MLIFPDNSLLKSEVSELRCLRACHDIAEACDKLFFVGRQSDRNGLKTIPLEGF